MKVGLILQQELKKTSSIKQQLVEAFQERIEDRTDFEISGPEEKKIFEETLKIVEEKTLPKYPISYFEQFSVLLNRCFFQAKGFFLYKKSILFIIKRKLYNKNSLDSNYFGISFSIFYMVKNAKNRKSNRR